MCLETTLLAHKATLHGLIVTGQRYVSRGFPIPAKIMCDIGYFRRCIANLEADIAARNAQQFAAE